MTHKRNGSRCALCIAVVLSTMILPALVQGQVPPSNLITVVVVQVHHDMRAEFEALEKQANAAFKEAGLKSRQIWQVVRGPSNEYHIVTPADKFADYDAELIGVKAMGEAEWTQWVATVTKCVQSRSVYTLRPMPELTIPAKEGQQPALAVLTTRVHAPGMGAEYREWLAKELVPAKKKAGIHGSYVYRSVFGDSPRTWVTAEFVSRWADFDRDYPLRESMGDRAYQTMLRKAGPMIVSNKRLILQHRPDLSF